MDFPSNQVAVGHTNVQDGFMARLAAIDGGPPAYDTIVDEDLTRTWVMPRILSWELQAYLNQYFPGWKLLRRVQEHQRSETRPRWKDVYYVIEVATDADADTLASHIRKTDYVMPYQQRAA